MGRLSVLPASIMSEKEEMSEDTSINSSTNKSGYISGNILNTWPIINIKFFLHVLDNAFNQLRYYPTHRNI